MNPTVVQNRSVRWWPVGCDRDGHRRPYDVPVLRRSSVIGMGRVLTEVGHGRPLTDVCDCKRHRMSPAVSKLQTSTPDGGCRTSATVCSLSLYRRLRTSSVVTGRLQAADRRPLRSPSLSPLSLLSIGACAGALISAGNCADSFSNDALISAGVCVISRRLCRRLIIHADACIGVCVICRRLCRHP